MLITYYLLLSEPVEPVDAENEYRGAPEAHFDGLGAAGRLAEERKALDRHDLAPRTALLAGEVDNGVDVFVLDAGKDCGAAAAQEAARGGDLGGRQAIAYQPADQAVGVGGARDDQKELQGRLVRIGLADQARQRVAAAAERRRDAVTDGETQDQADQETHFLSSARPAHQACAS